MDTKAPPMRHDEHFRSLGAVTVYDETYPNRYSYKSGQYTEPAGLFARYYFNAQGTEIGYVIPDVSNLPNVHPYPRTWGIPHTLVPL